MADYLAQVDSRRLPVRSAVIVGADDIRRRYVILNLLYQGIAREEFRLRFDGELENTFGAELDLLRQEGCLTENPKRIILSPRGRRFSSSVADLFASEEVKRLAESYE
jgi:coproporphyrinogen III oxidase-like Fe-S oxidoreductase